MKEGTLQKCREVEALIEQGVTRTKAMKQTNLGNVSWYKYCGSKTKPNKVGRPRLPQTIQARPFVINAAEYPSSANETVALVLGGYKDIARLIKEMRN